ncbi:amino acid permease-domain-containing protein [Cristinia sonorae]|uniref:Amino acid permease-domain-containing protein n=1 Tax=Cristinia sonorae TaxID=1940300 RepID=A0A8K0UU62_9AGAR|nr:amino acid permease-domain-containing protein [Cristinia sonorae]
MSRSESSSKRDTKEENVPSPEGDQTWIAIQPLPRRTSDTGVQQDPSTLPPPSFQASRFDIVLRRQHQRPKEGGGLKYPDVPSRFLNLSNTFEFSGWGILTRIVLDADDIKKGEGDIQVARSGRRLGQFTAAALAGNAVLGSVFYALPAVVAVANIYSPISLFMATMIMFLWRPVMEELASALPFGGAPYTYLLNVSSKWVALLGAAVLLLDFASTSVVSAATAASYLSGEVKLPFPVYVIAISVLVVFALVCLSGLRESARLALTLLSLHMITMIVMFIAAIIAWAKSGNGLLKENWETGRTYAPPQSIGQQIFNGFCIGVLGLTGFECVPSYVSHFKTGIFPSVLRNLHYPAILLNVLSMLFLMALVPFETILQGNNVLSALAEVAAGKWLRIWIVVDAVVVLCGGVLTGVLGACELAERLACDQLIPQIFLRKLITGAPAASIVAFLLFNCVLYASSGFSLTIISKMFSLVWLIVMTLFPLSALLLKFSRGRLPRARRVPLSVVFLTFAIVFTAIGGNIAIDPSIVGYAATYVVAIVTVFLVTMKKVHIVRWLFWLYDQSVLLHNLPGTKTWGDKMTSAVKDMRRQPVCLLINTDEINRLFHKALYVKQNEETSCLKLVHFYEEEEGIPSEMEANWKILDEAFPEITIDLVLVRGAFTPSRVAALSHRLQIPTTLMFMSCPGSHFPYVATDFGTRIISL